MSSPDYLESNLLGRFMEGFWGYGNPRAPIWFVGMEEAGAEKEEILKRITAWDARGSAKFEHVANYHRHIGVAENFDECPPRLQRTWLGLMRISLASQGLPTDTESVRRYQVDRWATPDGSECLTELFPLPKRRLRDWGYHQWSSRPDLRTAKIYYRTWRQPRIAMLRSAMETYSPKIVIFYGKHYKKAWEEICGGELAKGNITASILLGQRSTANTRFLFIPHTVKHGLRTVDFTELGAAIREILPR